VRQTLVVTNTGQLITGVTVRVDGKSKEPVLQVQLPYGLSLQDGVTIQVDTGESMKLGLATCDNAGCYASAPVPKKLLEAMMAGTQLHLIIKDVNKKDLKFTMPLAGFPASFDKIK
jgi:invasion protein IalB